MVMHVRRRRGAGFGGHWRRLLAGLLMGIAPFTAGAQAWQADGTEWVLRLADGRELRSAALVGAQMNLANGATLRIDAVEPHRDHRGLAWWAHTLSVRQPGQNWQPLCEPHSDGTRFAVVLPGRETADRMLVEAPGAFALSCSRGALAKCLRLGYRPWEADRAGRSMRPVFNACVRMVRADYGGTGQPHTEDGRQIDVYDDLGVQRPEPDTPLHFEAAWGEDGAVCVHHPRVASEGSLAQLVARYPRLDGHTGERCTEAFGRAQGALLFNRSAAP
jgi:hypothetical protein